MWVRRGESWRSSVGGRSALSIDYMWRSRHSTFHNRSRVPYTLRASESKCVYVRDARPYRTDPGDEWPPQTRHMITLFTTLWELCNCSDVWYGERPHYEYKWVKNLTKKKFNRAHFFPFLYLRWLIVVNWNWMTWEYTSEHTHILVTMKNVEKKITKPNETGEKNQHHYRSEASALGSGMLGSLFTTRTYADDCVVSLYKFFREIFHFHFFLRLKQKSSRNRDSSPKSTHFSIPHIFSSRACLEKKNSKKTKLELNGLDSDFLVPESLRKQQHKLVEGGKRKQQAKAEKSRGAHESERRAIFEITEWKLYF